jgi:shikimate kinase
MIHKYAMKNIYLIGFMGSGKSYLGKYLSEKFNQKFLDLDQFIEDSVQISIPQIFNSIGEEGFREKEANLLRKTADFNQYIISCGGGTPCFHDNMQWIKEHGISIYLKPPEELLFKRLNNQKSGRPLISSMSDEDLKNFISMKIIEREKFYEQADYIYIQSEDNDIPIDLEKFLEDILQRSRS